MLHHLDRLLLSFSGGRYTLAGLLTGLPVVRLTTLGARSGQPRTVPLLPLFNGDDVVLISSNWGGSRHPAWYHNLRANPQATLTYDGHTKKYHAREATEDEREMYWSQAIQIYPGWQAYKQRARHRRIPIVVLSPETADARKSGL